MKNYYLLIGLVVFWFFLILMSQKLLDIPEILDPSQAMRYLLGILIIAGVGYMVRAFEDIMEITNE